MDLAAKIVECETTAELKALESMYILNNVESELLYERRVELITRMCEWRYESKQFGLAVDISDSWTPEQRQQFLFNWQNDEPLYLLSFVETPRKFITGELSIRKLGSLSVL